MTRMWMMMIAATMAASVALAELKVGDAAPVFKATATGGESVTLDDFAGQWLVLYFYPKADTPGCTRESCSLRDGIEDLGKLNAAVLGVSVDTLEAQDRFKAKYDLPFSLLADKDKTVAKAYDVLGFGGMMASRKTFIINPEGMIAHVFKKVSVSSHAEEVAKELQRLQKAASPSG